MPELPEAETIARGLSSAVTGARITSVEIRLPRIAVARPGVDFSRTIAGDRIDDVGRRGKYVVLKLRSERLLVIGLRMTGRIVVQRSGESDFPATHVVFHLKGGRRIAFADVRTFGRVRLVDPEEHWDQELGVEPLGPGFTLEAFTGMLAGRTTPVKVLLLDQRRIAGIGNIYACEALWEAGIRPGRLSRAVTKPAARRLHQTVVGVLARAIQLRGSSIDDYVDAGGLKGGFQNVLSVYGRRGQPCLRCGRPIVRTVLAQRGTWWCRGCQH